MYYKDLEFFDLFLNNIYGYKELVWLDIVGLVDM